MTRNGSDDARWRTRRRQLDERFFEGAEAQGDCLVWQRARSREGYGHVMRNGRRIRAHRLAYILAVGPIPDGLDVLHSCDNPPCVNPAHLRVGTNADNVADMVGRNRTRGPRGELNGGARLKEADVRAIRASSAPSATVAVTYGITSNHVLDIRAGRRWKHVA